MTISQQAPAMIRPELRHALARHSEVLLALVPLGLGLWLCRLGGWVLLPAGLALVAAAVAWAVVAWRRLRFARDVGAPGVVEIDEGQIGYFGAGRLLGGQVALRDLAEIRLLHLNGRHLWRLKTADGQALLIPVDAAGAAQLYDAYASLPGTDMRAISAALDQRVTAQVLWKRASG
ncbi:hypothetical protein RPE78_04580 [Thioclava litoralis]|uniref:PH domain-containing protein n=1 Tax=Thioclava litoralis TaxID=3076557 RepID=A0ABZ1E3L9_9RHOB|nr:hypothetical protein RPE78_04580 [Thioclava sp. FTW29]